MAKGTLTIKGEGCKELGCCLFTKYLPVPIGDCLPFELDTSVLLMTRSGHQGPNVTLKKFVMAFSAR